MNLRLTQRKGITNRSNHLPKKKKNQTNNGPFKLGLGQWKLPRSKEEHEEKPWTSQQWQQRQNSTKVQNTESGIIINGFLTFSTFSGIPTKMGFFTPSLLNHLRLNAFERPLLSTLLCSLSLSPSYCISQFVVVNFLGHCDFLGLCSCRSFGFRLISIPLCYTQFRNIWKLHIVKNLILWKGMTTQPGFEHSYFSSATISDFAPRA